MISINRKFYLITFLQCLLVLSGCTQEEQLKNERSTSTGYNVRLGSSCFNKDTIQDYRVLDRSNLVIYGRPKSRSYHLQITPPASIRSSDSIYFNSRTGRICGFAGDELIIPDSIFSERHSIIAVNELDDIAHYNLLLRFGIGDPLEVVEPDKETSPEITRELSETDNQENDNNE